MLRLGEGVRGTDTLEQSGQGKEYVSHSTVAKGGGWHRKEGATPVRVQPTGLWEWMEFKRECRCQHLQSNIEVQASFVECVCHGVCWWVWAVVKKSTGWEWPVQEAEIRCSESAGDTAPNFAWNHIHKHLLMPSLSQQWIGPFLNISLHVDCRRKTKGILHPICKWK